MPHVDAMGLESREADCSVSGWLSMACVCPIHQQTVGTEVLVPGAQEVPSLQGAVEEPKE